MTLLSARMVSSTRCNVSGVAISTDRPARCGWCLRRATTVFSTRCNVFDVAISTDRPARCLSSILSAFPRTSAPNYGLPDVTGNVHRTWASFLCGYPLFPFFFAHKKMQNATLFYRGTRTQGRRHLVTAATSVQSCAYRSLCVTIKLDSAAI